MVVNHRPESRNLSATGGLPLLEVRNVTFGYSLQPIFFDVCLELAAGEMAGLLGPNGSGKTTLLRLLSGVLRPTQGEIRLQGRALGHWRRRELARMVAVVPQELHIPFDFTVEQLVALGRLPFVGLLGSYGPQDRARIEEAMRVTGVAALAERPFNELSGGERQRVLVAMALAQQPRLLLLDEPTAHLDIRYQIEVLELVQRLNREQGLTVLAAMHDLNLAARYFPRLVLFQRGIVADGTPATVLEPRLLSRVYGIAVQVGIVRGTAHFSVVPPGSREAQEAEEEMAALEPPPRVFVMAGGGSGERVMRALADWHIPFLAGVLNMGDSDHTLALRLASRVLTEQPYAPLSQAALEELRAALATVETLIICPMYVGPGNVALLGEALTAARQGCRVLLVAPETAETEPSDMAFMPDSESQELSVLLARTGIAARDYTGGEATRLVEQLLQAGAGVISRLTEALALCAV
ncbi:MAG: ABC transporter ATP-binding protein [Thermogemmatispora sp.]|uniref:ABC transporter ATP-binding protein n=1 Tax=Thermogemmatispora sp. TaxID=1968838 RepID=UPI0026237C79|nr:ABC transporter ATP-binding protein [Thermogemmatispora sp.]MBX5459199.1 ABC transporter ATP-binding protein [Thermogemmatispora sp.]